MLTHNFAAHHFVHMCLQGSHFARNFLQPIKRHDANLRIFECNGIASVVIIDDAIQANDFACHLKACHLIPAIFGCYASFEKTRANGIQRREGFSVAKQRCSTFDFAAGCHNVINALQLLLTQADRHAEFAQIAVGTGYFDGWWSHVLKSPCVYE